MAGLIWRHRVAGIALGLMSGLGLLIGIPLFQVVMLPTVIIVLLGAWSGWPAVAAAAVSHMVVGSLFGKLGVLVTFELFVLPAVVVLLMLIKRPRFGRGVIISVAAVLGAAVALLAGAWVAVRGDLVDAATQAMLQVPADFFSDLSGAMMSGMGQAGFYGNQTGLDFSRVLTIAEQRQLYVAMVPLIGRYFQEMGVSILLTVSAVTGGLSYWMAASIVARRGDSPAVSCAHVHDWRFGPDIALGLPLSALCMWIAQAMGLSAAEPVTVALLNLTLLVLRVQGLGAVARRLKKSGAPRGQRALILVALLIVGRYVLEVGGAYSALLGSQGVITKARKKRAGHDDDDKGDDGP